MRIISGQARGRKLRVPPEGTRPTSDRAKEGLFSSLAVRVGFDDIRVLDLFAGSGALGLEAASRGASHVVLVDNDHQAVEVIRENAKLIRGVDIDVFELKASAYLAGAPKEYFDLVLIDPPYALVDEAVFEMVSALRPHLADGAMVVVERPSASPLATWPAGYEETTQKLKKRTYGIARMDMAVFDREAWVAEDGSSVSDRR